MIPIPGYEASYTIDRNGTVTSLARQTLAAKNVRLDVEAHQMKHLCNCRDEPFVVLSKKCKRTQFLIKDLLIMTGQGE
jgi:hypothetical protein